MATRGLIAIEDTDGVCRSIYCHWDMNPECALQTLTTHYATRDKLEELLKLGNLSTLDETPETCCAFARDKGYEFEEPKGWNNKKELFTAEKEGWGYWGTEYAYLLTKDEKWQWKAYPRASR